MRSRRTTVPAPKRSRVLVVLLTAFALMATACGGGTTTTVEPLRASSLQPESAAEPVPWGVEPTVAPLPGEESSDSSTSAPKVASEPVVATEVLALAFAAPDELSYSFTQGISMTMEMPGLGGFTIAPDEPVAWGEVAGQRSHTVFDMGVILRETLAGLGAGSSFTDAKMEMWADESTLVMDMSPLASSLGAIDPLGAGELGLFADGPILIDLTQMPGLTGAEFASQYAQGSQVVDPALLLQSLRSVDAIRAVGPAQHNGVPVEAYAATITMTEYYEALGMDITDQLETSADLGLDAADAVVFDAVLGAMDALDVELRILVDENQLIHRLETTMDMQPMMSAMFEDPAVLDAMAAAEGATVEEMALGLDIVASMEYTIGTWQNFDNHGQAFDIVFPEAEDVTAEFAGTFEELLAS